MPQVPRSEAAQGYMWSGALGRIRLLGHAAVLTPLSRGDCMCSWAALDAVVAAGPIRGAKQHAGASVHPARVHNSTDRRSGLLRRSCGRRWRWRQCGQTWRRSHSPARCASIILEHSSGSWCCQLLLECVLYSSACAELSLHLSSLWRAKTAGCAPMRRSCCSRALLCSTSRKGVVHTNHEGAPVLA